MIYCTGGGGVRASAAGGQGTQGPVQLPGFLQQYMQEPPAGQMEYRYSLYHSFKPRAASTLSIKCCQRLAEEDLATVLCGCAA